MVHTPGHTPGHICLYASASGSSFAGDMLQVMRGRVTYASRFFSDDLPQARASSLAWRRWTCETIVFSALPALTDPNRGQPGSAAPRPGGAPPAPPVVR